MEQAITLITSNPARNLKLRAKGIVAQGADADLCFLAEDLQLTDVIARGKFVMQDGTIVKKETYELRRSCLYFMLDSYVFVYLQ